MKNVLTEEVILMISGSLVERNTAPDGIQLVNPFAVAKHESTDLVDLAKQIQMVRKKHWIFKYLLVLD